MTLRPCVLFALVSFCSLARASDAPSPELATTTAASATEQLIRIARSVPLVAPAAEVEGRTVELGQPVLSYAWCNGAGCVDKSKEFGATMMRASWHRRLPEGGFVSLSVHLCGGTGQWKAGAVHVTEFPKSRSAWGNASKPTELYENIDRATFGTCWER
jgi:hypothetical protein